jgi:cystathionine beta-synthase
VEFKENILEQIGNTPLVKINKINKGLKPQIFAKLESANPGGSVKDRIGYNMILAAEADGSLKPGGTIIEATSGNTGIGIALTAAVKGYKTIFVVTDKVSDEKINYLKAFGGEVIVVSNAVEPDHPEYYVTVAKKIQKETPNSIFAYQYSNPSNPEMHYRTTGPELWRQTEGKITHFVSSIGTGGTISGTGRYLKEKNPDIQVIAADPFGSIFKDYKETGTMPKGAPYLVEGIGQDCLPENVHFQYFDKVINVSDKDSFHYARMLTKEEGIFCGGSTGTIVKVALEISENLTENDIVVFIVCDTGERYLTKVHNLDWLKQHRMLDSDLKTLKDLSERKHVLGFNQLLYVNDTINVKEAIQLMSEKGFTQLPVFNENHESVGSIRENRLMKKIFEDSSKLDAKVCDLMEEAFPIFDSATEVIEIKEALKTNSAVLVIDKGRISDIITRYDLLEI